MSFFSKDHSFNSKIKPLFEYVKSRSVPVKFLDISDQGSFNWEGTHGEWEKDEFTFLLAENVLARCNGEGRLTVEYGAANQSCSLLEGVPARVHTEQVDNSTLCRLYIDDAGKMLQKSGLLGQDVRFVKEISHLTHEIFHAIENNAETLSVPLTRKLVEFKKLSHSAGKKANEKLAIYSSNCATLLELCCQGDSQPSKQAGELADLLRKTVSHPVKQAEDFLYAANYYADGCFFSPHKLDISPKDREKVAEMHEALLQCDKREVDFFFSERKRLEEIMGSLHDGTLWEEMKKVNDQATIVSEEPLIVEKNIPIDEPAPIHEVKVQDKPKGRDKKSSFPRWLLILLILLLLGGGGYLAFDHINRGETSFVSSFLGTGTGTVGSMVDDSSTTEGSVTEDGSPWKEDGDTVPFSRDVVTDKVDAVIDPGPRDDANITEPKINGEAPEIDFVDHKDTVVTKPLIMDSEFLNNFEIDGVLITMADIHLKANDIAVMNGYRDLGFNVVKGKDPTIIEPGLVLKIPGFMTYTVKSEDNIWYIAARLLESEVRSSSVQFDNLVKEHEQLLISRGETEGVVKKMNTLAENSSSENFKKKVENWLENL